MNTQALSTETSNNPLTVPNKSPQTYAPKPTPVRNAFTDLEKEELKQIIKECLREFHYTTH